MITIFWRVTNIIGVLGIFAMNKIFYKKYIVKYYYNFIIIVDKIWRLVLIDYSGKFVKKKKKWVKHLILRYIMLNLDS